MESPIPPLPKGMSIEWKPFDAFLSTNKDGNAYLWNKVWNGVTIQRF